MEKNWPLPFAIAHRGAPRLAPENTLSALKAAQKQGAKAVECDVQFTQDEQLVIFHDDTLERMTANPAALSALDLKSLSAIRIHGECIPTLTQWLKTCAELKLSLNLEVKTHCETQSEKLTQAVLMELRRHPYFTAENTLLSSASVGAMRALLSQKDFLVGFISDKKISDGVLADFAMQSVASVHHHHVILNDEYIQKIHDYGFRVLAYTVNDLSELTRLQNMHIDGVFTDNEKLYDTGDR